jgi:hypothetical protein
MAADCRGQSTPAHPDDSENAADKRKLERSMKEALTIVMLLLLIVPLLVGVRRIRRLPRPSDKEQE